MPSETSKTALRLLHKTEHLATSLRSHRDTLLTALAGLPEVRDPAGDPVPPPDWSHTLDWCLASLESSAAEIRATDQAYREILVRRTLLQDERTASRARLHDGHRALRETFIGTYGRPSLPLVGLDDLPARGTLAAREQLREVVSRLRDPDLTGRLPAPLAGQKPIQLEKLANARQLELDRYATTVENLIATRHRTLESRSARNQARADNRRLYSNVARIAEGALRLAGLGDLADELRVTNPASRKGSGSPL